MASQSAGIRRGIWVAVVGFFVNISSGNGGSAAHAQHLVAELTERFLVERQRTGLYFRPSGSEGNCFLSSGHAGREFTRQLEKELTGRNPEPSKLIYFKVYKSQVPVIEQAIDAAALMLGSDKSRGTVWR